MKPPAEDRLGGRHRKHDSHTGNQALAPRQLGALEVSTRLVIDLTLLYMTSTYRGPRHDFCHGKPCASYASTIH